MKVLRAALVIGLLGTGCGSVKEKEVKLEMLPEGETNASYSSTNTTTTDDEEEDDTDTETTVELTPLQKVLAEIETQRTNGSCGAAAGCAFAAQYPVVNAVVMAIKPCNTNGTTKCGTSGTARSGVDWIYAQEIGGAGMLINPFGWTSASTTAAIAIGDKISFTPTHLRYFVGRGYVLKIDETTLTVTHGTAKDLFQVGGEILDLDSVDFSKKNTDNFYKMVSGTFKVNSTATTISSDTGAKWYTLNTKTFATDAGFYLRGSSTALTKDKCYTVKNMAMIWTTTPTTAGYAIDIVGFDFANVNYGLGSLTETDCTAAGL